MRVQELTSELIIGFFGLVLDGVPCLVALCPGPSPLSAVVRKLPVMINAEVTAFFNVPKPFLFKDFFPLLFEPLKFSINHTSPNLTYRIPPGW